MSSEPDPRSPSAEPSPDGSAPAETAPDVARGGPDAAAGPGPTDPPPSAPSAPSAGTGPDPTRPVVVGPQAMRKPERTETRMKDILGAVLILIPIALLIVGVGRGCSFAPTGPELDPGAGPTVDAPARLTEYARVSTFGLRVPDVPWRSNSTDRGPVQGGGTAVRVGYLTEQGRYLRLVQSDASEEGLLATEGGPGSTAEGVTRAAGRDWVTYRGNNGEPVRIATLPGSPTVRLLITGSGTDDEFRALAEATVRARVLPPGGQTN
ncbi:DUF4245 domain-containing protein [Pseudonocardia endophytica]|uniref:DUF4245 domain-containing protein n=1 Tax=Pseudonocardia endophytica TaxID=401976 RepID=UPI0014050C18|nr:DUF4245 domain-containing protein [Pseudonocardia endophytica]